jgi:hypothetical protein
MMRSIGPKDIGHPRLRILARPSCFEEYIPHSSLLSGQVMFARIICLLWFAATFSVTTAWAQSGVAPAPPPGPAPAPGGVRIWIENVYEAELNFGPLGKGWRKGTDSVQGVLNRQGVGYIGTVEAKVKSKQQMTGMLGVGSCGPEEYIDSQHLKVVGHVVSGFNDLVQSVTPAATATPGSNEFLLLEFSPESMSRSQFMPRLPPTTAQDPFLEDLVINCHTLIDTPSGIAFIALNDSRWTMEDGGYIIALPQFGVLNYSDNTLAAGAGAPALPAMPFKAKKSLWTIEVERF